MTAEKDRPLTSAECSEVQAEPCDPDLSDLITTMRETYHDCFGRYPSERQMEDFLESHPGALDMWKATKR